MQSELVHTELRFDAAEDVAIHWAARTNLEHALDLEHLEDLYERALPILRAYCYALTTKHDWVEDADITRVGDTEVAVCIGRDEQFIVDDGNHSATHVSRLVLPRHFSAFTDPELAQDWATMFSNLVMTTTTDTTLDIYQLGRAGMPRPLQNVIYLLQCISPGLIVVRSFKSDDEFGDAQITDCGLPPALWVGEHIEHLEDVFGTVSAISLYRASDDPYSALEDIDAEHESGSSDTMSDSSFDSFDYDEGWSSWNNSEDDIAQIDITELELLHGEGNVKEITATNQESHISKPFIISSSKKANKKGGKLAGLVVDDSDQDGYRPSYRHCDDECNYCGGCDDNFAERLTELLLRTAIAA